MKTTFMVITYMCSTERTGYWIHPKVNSKRIRSVLHQKCFLKMQSHISVVLQHCTPLALLFVYRDVKLYYGEPSLAGGTKNPPFGPITLDLQLCKKTRGEVLLDFFVTEEIVHPAV